MVSQKIKGLLSTMVRGSTKTNKTSKAILDAAEKLFAIQGVNAVSLRQVAIEAKVDAASIAYHFGKKENLVDAVIARRVTDMNNARLKALAEALERTRNEPDVEDVLEAMFRPWLDLYYSGDPGWQYYSKMVARMTIMPQLTEIFHNHMGDVERHFMNAFRLALPDLDDMRLHWGAMFVLGSAILLFSETPRLDLTTDGRISAKNIREGYEIFIKQSAEGLRSL